MKTEQEIDLEFLLNRCMKAGSCSFTDERETGISSNSIVAIAYGYYDLDKQELPGDWSDLNACENMWKKLPQHRKNEKALKAMENARNYKQRRQE